MRFASLSLAAFVFLLAGCTSNSGDDTHELRVDAFSDLLLFLKSNSTKQGDTLVVNVVPAPLPVPSGWGANDTLILYKKGEDLTANLPTHTIDTLQVIIGLGIPNYKYVLYASDARPASPLSCSIDNRGKKFVKAAVHDTSDVFQERLHDGTKGYYRLIDTTETVTEFPCDFYLGAGYYVNYGGTNIRYYGDIIIRY